MSDNEKFPLCPAPFINTAVLYPIGPEGPIATPQVAWTYSGP